MAAVAHREIGALDQPGGIKNSMITVDFSNSETEETSEPYPKGAQRPVNRPVNNRVSSIVKQFRLIHLVIQSYAEPIKTARIQPVNRTSDSEKLILKIKQHDSEVDDFLEVKIKSLLLRIILTHHLQYQEEHLPQ